MPTSFVTALQECARALNDLGGPYAVASATSATVVVTELINAATGASTSDYDERYAYFSAGTGAGTAARIKSASYVPASGTLAPARTAWPTTPDNTSILNLTSLFPAIRGIAGEDADYRSLINQSLGLIDIPRRLAPPITTTGEYALTTWVAWIREDRIARVPALLPDGRRIRSLDVREPPPVSGFPHQMIAAREWEYIGDEDTPKLRSSSLFANTTGSPTLEVMATGPAWSWTKVGGTWGEGGGFVDPTDEVLPETDHIVDVFLPLAYRNIMNRQPGAPSDPQAMKKFTDAVDRARSVPGYNRAAEQQAMPEVAALEGLAA